MLSKIRNRHLVIIDIILILLTPTISLTLRVPLPWEDRFTIPLLIYTLFSVPIKISIFYIFNVYKRLWRYASIDALIAILMGVGVSGVVLTGVYYALSGTGILGTVSLPRLIPLIDSILTLLVVSGTRLSLRIAEYQSGGGHSHLQGKRILIAGAGDAGQMVAREIHTSKHVSRNLVGFVDDDPVKIGTVIHNVPVLGPLVDIPKLVESYKIQEVIIAMPAVPGSVIRRVVENCELSGVSAKTLPGIYELLRGEVSVNRLREVQIGDLLRRHPVKVSSTRVKKLLAGKRVLVTGAGGSIGAELCEQIVLCSPAKLIVFGHGENSLYQLPNRLSTWSEEEKKERLEIVIGDIRDRFRIDVIFSRFQPEIVYHTAAHKHVPLMEENIEDAVTNNIKGTRNLVDFCQKHQVGHFVLISTDKAVEPISTMGMTKRVAELIVRKSAEETGFPYVSVRFGNVLGSRGSVVPLFQRQIAAGGPVTITHPDIKRYFMTIQEAVQLVLQASAMGTNGEIFVLDMGEQIKIAELAQDIIELSGLELGEDIEILYTGLRPGEKIAEKLHSQKESPFESDHEKIMIVKQEISISTEMLKKKVDELILLAEQGEKDQLFTKLKKFSAQDW